MINKPTLAVNNLTFAYNRKVPILNGINLMFEPGKITALLGINGSGKTTLLRILAGITHANSGEIIYGKLDVNKNNVLEYKGYISYMPELLQLYPNMTTYNVLAFLAQLKNCSKQEVMQTFKKVGLETDYQKKVQSLSKGLKQRLNLAQALLGKPKIIICDEPSNGFDCDGVKIFYSLLRELADQGAIVIITTHLFSELFSHVDNIPILIRLYEKGRKPNNSAMIRVAL